MKWSSKSILLAFILAAIGGTLLHFVYGWFPNPITMIFAPVNESIWDHLKLIYWPFLAAALLLTRKGESGCRAPWLLSLLIICAALLGVGYWFHILLQGDSMWFDIILYLVLMAAGFLLPRLFAPLAGKGWWSEALGVLVALLGGAIVLFSFLPPDQILFVDLSAVRTWLTIPY